MALSITRADGREIAFQVELADTSEERQVGLMNRKSMQPDHGMLFDFGASRRVFMWMHDTLIPLDMLFIDGRGRISHIHANAKPLDETVIDSQAVIRYVLEINGGQAQKLGLAIGDRVKVESILP